MCGARGWLSRDTLDADRLPPVVPHRKARPMCGTTERAVRELPAGPLAPGEARRFLREAGCTEHATALLESAVLLVSETVTNAVRQGGPPLVVEVDCDEVSLQVRVRDGSAALPVARQARPEDEGGRGLQLLDLLSHDWGVDPEPDGKAVWFRLRQDAAG